MATTDSQIEAAKLDMRRQAAARRAKAHDAAGPDVYEAMGERFLEAIELPRRCVVAGYWPSRTEADPRPLLERLSELGHLTALPIVEGAGHALTFRLWQPGQELTPWDYGIMQPSKNTAEIFPDIILTPMLAFDRSGFRLGYGGGYYDRTLAAQRCHGRTLAVGFGFAAQEVEAVPRDSYDEQLDWIITERYAVKVAR